MDQLDTHLSAFILGERNMNTAFKRAGGRMLEAKVGFFYANHMQTLHKVTCFPYFLQYLTVLQ